MLHPPSTPFPNRTDTPSAYAQIGRKPDGGSRSRYPQDEPGYNAPPASYSNSSHNTEPPAPESRAPPDSSRAQAEPERHTPPASYSNQVYYAEPIAPESRAPHDQLHADTRYPVAAADYNYASNNLSVPPTGTVRMNEPEVTTPHPGPAPYSNRHHSSQPAPDDDNHSQSSSHHSNSPLLGFESLEATNFAQLWAGLLESAKARDDLIDRLGKDPHALEPETLHYTSTSGLTRR